MTGLIVECVLQLTRGFRVNRQQRLTASDLLTEPDVQIDSSRCRLWRASELRESCERAVVDRTRGTSHT